MIHGMRFGSVNEYGDMKMKKCMATLLAGMMLSTATAFAAPSEHETIEQVALEKLKMTRRAWTDLNEG